MIWILLHIFGAPCPPGVIDLDMLVAALVLGAVAHR
jgi:hypothetical protein